MKNKTHKTQQLKTQTNDTEEVKYVIISRCMNCKEGVMYPFEFEIPPKDDNYPKCNNCGHKDLQFYRGKYRKEMKGGAYRMADDKPKKVVAKKAAKPKAEKSDKKKSPRGYGDDVRDKVIEMGKNGRTVKDIEKSLGPTGPKTKAIIRYLKAANIKDIKRK